MEKDDEREKEHTLVFRYYIARVLLCAADGLEERRGRIPDKNPSLWVNFKFDQARKYQSVGHS
jgi:hypothetical protein